MKVSVEVPVFKHKFLKETIRSVLMQEFDNWHLYLLSDGASAKARKIMTTLGKHPKISIRFEENCGIGPSRRKLTDWSDSDYIVPLDDDDILLPDCLTEMVACMDSHERAGLVRARRKFVDQKGRILDESCWFPFEERKMFLGMTCDVHNHSQPCLIRREAYDKTEGWFGFHEYGGAGEDCDIFLKIEEVAEIVLLDKVLYGYRLHRKRFSRDLGSKSAYQMWKRLADMTIRRRGLKLRRVNDKPPFEYERIDAG
ncbi:glycosyltransferase [Thermodesulfobacteriota bacterium]